MPVSPDPQENQSTLQLILQFHDAFNRQDLPAVMALMTEDCLFDNTYPPPDGACFKGSAAVRDEFAAFFRSSLNARFEVEEAFACGDRAVLRWVYYWSAEGSAPGHVRGVDVFKVRDGKIAEKRSYVKG